LNAELKPFSVSGSKTTKTFLPKSHNKFLGELNNFKTQDSKRFSALRFSASDRRFWTGNRARALSGAEGSY
jgi:hypothetical protein